MLVTTLQNLVCESNDGSVLQNCTHRVSRDLQSSQTNLHLGTGSDASFHILACASAITHGNACCSIIDPLPFCFPVRSQESILLIL